MTSFYLVSGHRSCQRKRNVKRKIYLKKKANTDRIKQELQTLATAREFNSPGVSVDNMWDHFERNVRRIMDTCIPHKMTTIMDKSVDTFE